MGALLADGIAESEKGRRFRVPSAALWPHMHPCVYTLHRYAPQHMAMQVEKLSHRRSCAALVRVADVCSGCKHALAAIHRVSGLLSS